MSGDINSDSQRLVNIELILSRADLESQELRDIISLLVEEIRELRGELLNA